MDRSLTMELVRVTEAAAVSSARWMGFGKKEEADQAATTAMRKVFDTIPMEGTVVIGEGEMDEAPMLYIGERLGTGSPPEVDVAVDRCAIAAAVDQRAGGRDVGGEEAVLVVGRHLLADRGNFGFKHLRRFQRAAELDALRGGQELDPDDAA